MPRGSLRGGKREKTRQEKPVTLIICEGETERGYFQDIKRRYRARGIEVRLTDHATPKKIVECARREASKLRKKGLEVNTWLVFDAESKATEIANDYKGVIIASQAAGISVANSSPCFEYWLLLHFVPGIKVIEPDEAVRELSKPGRIEGYEKPSLPYDELWEIMLDGKPQKAAQEARGSYASLNENPRFGRPVTYVDCLTRFLSDNYGDTESHS